MKKKWLLALPVAVLLWAAWYFFVPMELELSPDSTIERVERLDATGDNLENIVDQLSESDLEAIRQVLLTTSYSRHKRPLTTFSICENTVLISIWDDAHSRSIHFYLVDGEGRYEVQLVGNDTHRIRNGEEILKAIQDIIA